MKKIILLISLIVAMSVNAAQVVPIVWPFSVASNQSNALRTIIENANKSQSKYQFIFDSKPGAGGAIAINHMLQNKEQLIVVMTSTSVFTRPLFYPDSSYNIDELVPISVLSTGSPLSLISKKYKNLTELKSAKNISIGIVAGSTTEVMASTVGKKLNNVVLVPYTGTTTATRDVLSDVLDVSVEFIKDATPWIENGTLHSIGITGRKDVGIYKSFNNQGIKGLEHVVNNWYMLTSKNVSLVDLVELNGVFNDASNNTRVDEIWRADGGQTEDMYLDQTEKFWNEQKKLWREK